MLEQIFIKIKQLILWSSMKVDLSREYFLKNKDQRRMPVVKMGEIYYAFLGVNIGSEIDKIRPVLIFQANDKYINNTNMVIAIPITSNTAPGPYRILIQPEDILENKSLHRSTVLVQQIRSISKSRLTTYEGILSKEKLLEVSLELNKLLYKNIPLLSEGYGQTVLSDPPRPIE